MSQEKELQRKIAKQKAQDIVIKYTTGGILGSVQPIPFADIALVSGTQATMIWHINNIYGFEISRERTLEIIALILSVVGSGFALRCVGNAIKCLPGVGSFVGGALNASVAIGSTKLLGKAYIAYLDAHYDDLNGALNDLKNNQEELKKYL